VIAPMLCGVVYFNLLSDFVLILKDCNVRRVYLHSFWAKVPRDETEDHPMSDQGFRYVDCHCLAGLTSFANAFKIVVRGGVLQEPDNTQVVRNRNLVGGEFRKLWKPGKGEKIRLLIGQVIDHRPPPSTWVPLHDFLAGETSGEFPVLDYTGV